MTVSYWLAAAFAGSLAASPPNPPFATELKPLKPEFVRGEPIFLLLSITNELDAESHAPGGVLRGRWEHRNPGTGWEACLRNSWETQVPSEVSLQMHGGLKPRESRILGLVSPICIETKGQSVYEVRLVGASCCRTSGPITIKVVQGNSADARARAAPRDWGDFPDSVLAGYDYLSPGELDRMYDDPVEALKFGEYRTLRPDKVGPSIERMKAFLSNFPSFPFAQSIRLRLATELALAGRTSEAQGELRKITGTPQEPRVRADAQRLQAALLERSGTKDGGSTLKGDR